MYWWSKVTIEGNWKFCLYSYFKYEVCGNILPHSSYLHFPLSHFFWYLYFTLPHSNNFILPCHILIHTYILPYHILIFSFYLATLIYFCLTMPHSYLYHTLPHSAGTSSCQTTSLACPAQVPRQEPLLGTNVISGKVDKFLYQENVKKFNLRQCAPSVFHLPPRSLRLHSWRRHLPLQSAWSGCFHCRPSWSCSPGDGDCEVPDDVLDDNDDHTIL